MSMFNVRGIVNTPPTLVSFVRLGAVIGANFHQRVFECVERNAELNGRALGSKEGSGATIRLWASGGHNTHCRTHNNADDEFHWYATVLDRVS
mgnify:FL=1